MARFKSTRRTVLQGLASGTVVGALGSLQSGSAFGGSHSKESTASIAGLTGNVVRRGDENYETWRQSLIWHKDKPHRYPDMIVQALSVDDVKRTVKYAAENKLKISMRSGGHNATGAALRDSGIALDLSNLAGIAIDAGSQIARVQPGAISIALTSDAAAQGFAFPTPHCPTVGMGGFLMGGGIGWNYTHRGGFSCLSIEGAEIVTADGELVMATRDENPDLYWAVRGAGPGFFGVVTRFHLKIYPLPQGILSSSYILPLEEVETMTTAMDALDASRDDRLEVLCALMHNPAAAPDAQGGDAKICFVSAYAFGNSVAESRDMLKPLADSAIAKKAITKAEYEAFSLPELYRFFLPDSPAGAHARYACDSIMTDELSAAVVAAAEHFPSTPSPLNHVLAGYGMNLRHRDDSCLSSIAKHYLGTFIIWQDEADDERNETWLDESLPLTDPFAKGHYVSEVEVARHPEHIVECFSVENWQRLNALRTKYDPDGVFHNYLGYS